MSAGPTQNRRPPPAARRPGLPRDMTAPASSLSPAGLWARLVAGTRAFVTPGPRMVDELECVASVLLAIAFGHLAGAQNISWAAFSGYMVMRGHVAESLLRGTLRIVGTALGAGLALALPPFVGASAAGAAAALAAVGGISLYG